jgi:hypothetical protein
VTVLAFAYDHWALSSLFILVAGMALSSVVGAAVEPLKTWRRPGDCPRCGGTGREP